MNKIITNEIDKNKIFTCLLGHPVSHSISPAMHNASFDKLGVKGQYFAYDLLPEDLDQALKELKDNNITGFNLTMPLKTAIIPYLDQLDITSQLSGSVNTVLNKEGKLIGYTTDGGGYMDSLTDVGINIIGENMTILGAGGAATSIISQAALDGVKEIFIMRRMNEKAAATIEFAKKVSSMTQCKVSVCDINNISILSDCIAKSKIVTNCTNVGMGDDKNSLVPIGLLREDLIVSDIIYHPEMTKLLCDAKDKGCRYINGKYMLLFQGARAFKIWTGQDMPVEYIKEEIFK